MYLGEIDIGVAINVPVFVQDSSGNAVTGKVNGDFTKRISKGGGAFGAMTVTLTEMENGWYLLPVSASHSDTLLKLSVTLIVAGAINTNLEFMVRTPTWDEVLTGGTHNITNSAGRRLRAIQENAGYEGGAVWYNSVDGTAGTTPFEHGVVNTPSLLYADVVSLLASVGLHRVECIQGSTAQFTSATTRLTFDGHNYTIDLNGQDVDDVVIMNGIVFGEAVGNGGLLVMDTCLVTNATLPDCFNIPYYFTKKVNVEMRILAPLQHDCLDSLIVRFRCGFHNLLVVVGGFRGGYERALGIVESGVDVALGVAEREVQRQLVTNRQHEAVLIGVAGAYANVAERSLVDRGQLRRRCVRR